MVLALHPLSHALWLRLSEQRDVPFQQAWSYGAAAEALGAEALRLEVRDGQEVVAFALGIRRRFGVRITLAGRGPVWTRDPDPGCRTEVLKLMRRELPGVFVVTPVSEEDGASARSAGMWPVKRPEILAEWQLGDDMRTRMHGKWRNRLCRAEASGLVVSHSRRMDDLRWLLDRDRDQQRIKRYRALPRAFAEAWAAQDPASVHLSLATLGGERVAACLVLSHGSRATYHVGWSGVTGRRLSAHNLLLWSMARRLGDKGVKILDLGLLDTESAPGLARFKLGTGAVAATTGGTWLGLPRLLRRAPAPGYRACRRGSQA